MQCRNCASKASRSPSTDTVPGLTMVSRILSASGVPWPDESWKGWWGDEPPYHTPVFVLTHHPRAPLKMNGGTEFRFVTEGIHAALELARAAAGARDIRLGGGVSAVRQYLRAALIDELHLAIRPVLLGSGEHLLNDIDVRALGYECAKYVAGERAAHVFLRKRA